jgi:hypothetical protein
LVNKLKTRCVNDHEFDEENTYRWRDECGRWHRFCRICHLNVTRKSSRRPAQAGGTTRKGKRNNDR